MFALLMELLHSKCCSCNKSIAKAKHVSRLLILPTYELSIIYAKKSLSVFPETITN